MATTTITRRLEFDSAHRVLNHESRCKHIHGHRYRADIRVTAPGLDSIGRVIDFSCIKELVGGWIDANWDHNLILCKDDPLAEWFEILTHRHISLNEESLLKLKDVFGGKAPYIMANPTAENMAEELFNACCKLLPSPLTVIRVRLWETPNSFADYER